MRICMCVCVYVCVYVCICMCVCMYVLLLLVETPDRKPTDHQSLVCCCVGCYLYGATVPVV